MGIQLNRVSNKSITPDIDAETHYKWNFIVNVVEGIVYFFSMATSFTKAALGAEGVGKDVNMIIGNGFSKDHAEITLEILRESPILRKMFEEKYV